MEDGAGARIARLLVGPAIGREIRALVHEMATEFLLGQHYLRRLNEDDLARAIGQTAGDYEKHRSVS